MISVSCGIYKKYERPENVVADSTLFGEVVTDTTSLASLGWRELFTDPQLQSLIQAALDNNTDLKKAQLSVEQASSCCFRYSTASRRFSSLAMNASPSSKVGRAARKSSSSALSFFIRSILF